MVNMEQDLHKLTKRKAGAPIHVKVGVPGENVNKEDIDDVGKNLKFMTTRTEWVTDANTEMKVLDFAGLTSNLTDTLEYDLQLLATSVNVPRVLLGKANVPEGLAKVQGEAFQRFIKSVREEIEDIIEEKIFKPLLLANKFPSPEAKGLDKKAIGSSIKVDFIWALPGEDETNARIEKIAELLKGFNLSENMIRMLQLELAKLLDLKDADRFLLTPEKGVDEQEKEKEVSPEQKEEEEIPQPEVPGAKPSAKSKAKLLKLKHMKGEGCGQQISEAESGLMTIKQYCDLKELAGFNYSDYLVRILKRTRIDNFENLAAITKEDVANGLLTKADVNRLRYVLRDGFRQNKTIREIQKEIEESVRLKDRLKDGKVTMAKERRPNMIARTETVRLANAGLLDTYKDNKIEMVRFLAALSERTCPICEGLNGQVFNINEAEDLIPVHSLCRCTFTSIT